MRIILLIMLFVAGLLVYDIAYGVALAQQVSSPLIVGDLIAPWLQMLLGAVSVLVTAIVGWLAARIEAKTGIEIEARHREALQTALTNGAGLILNNAAGKVKDVSFDIRNPLVRDGVEYVLKAVPDAVEKFHLSPEQLSEKLVAKLGMATAPRSSDSQ